MADDDDRLAREVRARRARKDAARRAGERSLAQNLALAGSIGWLVVLPALAGTALGRWLDRRNGGGITFTAALLALGVAWGMYMAWRRVQAEG